MSAHDKTGSQPAHTPSHPPDSPDKVKFINVDESGISMSGRTAVAILAALVTTLLAVVGYAASLSTKDDLGGHDTSDESHEVTLDEDGDGKTDEDKAKPVAEHLANHEAQSQDHRQMFIKVKNEVGDNTTAIHDVNDRQQEQMATDVAYRAVDQMPQATPPRRKIQRFEEIKKRAKANMKAKRSIHDGIESAAF